MLMKSLPIQFITYIKSLPRNHIRKSELTLLVWLSHSPSPTWPCPWSWQLRNENQLISIRLQRASALCIGRRYCCYCCCYCYCAYYCSIICRSTYVTTRIPRGIRIHWLNALKAQPEKRHFSTKPGWVWLKSNQVYNNNNNMTLPCHSISQINLSGVQWVDGIK